MSISEVICDVHLWCSLYVPELVYVNLFEETLISLVNEEVKPGTYKFCISGKCVKKCSKTRIRQYEGFKLLQQSYDATPSPKFIILLDGDDIVAHDRTKMMYEYAQKYNKAIITVVGKFIHTDFDETLSEILPMAIENGFIEELDRNVYTVYVPFVSGEETSTLILPYSIISKYLLSDVDLTNNYADVFFYEHLIKTDTVLLVVPSKPVYLYREWDRGDHKTSLHH